MACEALTQETQIEFFAGLGLLTKTKRPERFQVEINRGWCSYSRGVHELLQQAYTDERCFGSIQFLVKGHMYLFDFQSMEQTNMQNAVVAKMKAPCDVERPLHPNVCSVGTVMDPLRSCGAGRDRLQPPSVYVVRLPEQSLGPTVEVPHPKKLGKRMLAAVPKDAKPGQYLFMEVPRKVSSKVKIVVGGAAGAAVTGIAAGGSGGAATGGLGVFAVAGGGVAAAALAQGAAVLVALGLSAAAVGWATQNKGKAVAIGSLTLGGVAFADHVVEVGPLAAAEDVVDAVRGATGAAGDAIGAAVDAVSQEPTEHVEVDRGADVVDRSRSALMPNDIGKEDVIGADVPDTPADLAIPEPSDSDALESADEWLGPEAYSIKDDLFDGVINALF